ncbi:MAG: winged helix-turn-helix transcriptional regulator [Candidatus Cloacimonetes bacterium]|nr:winged helix-turn-helix transcriptional regulator [Candidatus Cloacimonadota bacterium]
MTNLKTETQLFKALSDPTRMQILDMLSCGELCACDILEGLTISQSTLSHHMKVLLECNLVSGRKDATWMYYTINQARIDYLHMTIDILTKPKDGCICHEAKKAGSE